MTPDLLSSTDGAIARIERGLDLLFATEVVKDILDGVDVEALASGADYDDAVDYQQVGEALGRVAGRGVSRRFFENEHFLVQTVGEAVVGRVGATVVRGLLTRTDPQATLEWLATLSPDDVRGLSSDRKTVGNALEDGDEDFFDDIEDELTDNDVVEESVSIPIDAEELIDDAENSTDDVGDTTDDHESATDDHENSADETE